MTTVSALGTPNLLTDPGVLLWAPIGTTEPTGTVANSVFTDAWDVAWVELGMTTTGSQFTSNLTVAEIDAAESFYPIAWRTTGVAATVTFACLDVTATNISRALNGAVKTVTGSTTTTMTTIDPVSPGAEVRCMLGWESLDKTVRWVARQVINSGSVQLDFAKAPATTSIPWTGNLEKPAAALPWRMWTAGAARG